VHVSLRCLFTGHDDLIRRHDGRIYLECFECGRESAGWTVDTRQTLISRR
jgi:hypothetical protein